ncbi:hypothetical protein ZHAS_00005519 [Anopheles sinensis]|uniref:Uncharacterized protein n=1 Tax=Anopheles sinensis TaxID=74873 RepID=A0A084VJR2_ANOSI|nr:hypothetical protein ZHAS_00005519 [Anopheles sinensis]
MAGIERFGEELFCTATRRNRNQRRQNDRTGHAGGGFSPSKQESQTPSEPSYHASAYASNRRCVNRSVVERIQIRAIQKQQPLKVCRCAGREDLELRAVHPARMKQYTWSGPLARKGHFPQGADGNRMRSTRPAVPTMAAKTTRD